MSDQPEYTILSMEDDTEEGAVVSANNGTTTAIVEHEEEDYLWPDDTPVDTKAAVRADWEEFRSRALSHGFDTDELLSSVEKVYSTSQTAAFFGRSTQWIYWGLRPDPKTGQQVFSYRDGSPILPERVGRMGKRRFTLPLIRQIALACYRRGNLTEEELEAVMARILLAEFGRRAFADK